MILAIAAISLNLILGYGGLVSFGHAGISYRRLHRRHHGFYGITSGWLQWPAPSLPRARRAGDRRRFDPHQRIYFIMITLAFTQMLYYLGISLEEYGATTPCVSRREPVAG